MKILTTILTLLIISTLGSSLAFAQDEDALTRADKVSTEIMSPYCPGRTLAACPSDDARTLRAEIAQWFTEGYSETGVRERLQMIYGETVFGVPQRYGVGLLGWYAPAIFVISGLLLIYFILKRRMKKLAASDINFSATISSQEREGIEKELKKRIKQ